MGAFGAAVPSGFGTERRREPAGPCIPLRIDESRDAFAERGGDGRMRPVITDGENGRCGSYRTWEYSPNGIHCNEYVHYGVFVVTVAGGTVLETGGEIEETAASLKIPKGTGLAVRAAGASIEATLDKDLSLDKAGVRVQVLKRTRCAHPGWPCWLY